MKILKTVMTVKWSIMATQAEPPINCICSYEICACNVGMNDGQEPIAYVELTYMNDTCANLHDGR